MALNLVHASGDSCCLRNFFSPSPHPPTETQAATRRSTPAVYTATAAPKLAPMTAKDAPPLTEPEFELTPPELIDCVMTEEGGHPPEEIAALVDRTPFLRAGYALLGR